VFWREGDRFPGKRKDFKKTKQFKKKVQAGKWDPLNAWPLKGGDPRSAEKKNTIGQKNMQNNKRTRKKKEKNSHQKKRHSGGGWSGISVSGTEIRGVLK